MPTSNYTDTFVTDAVLLALAERIVQQVEAKFTPPAGEGGERG